MIHRRLMSPLPAHGIERRRLLTQMVLAASASTLLRPTDFARIHTLKEAAATPRTGAADPVIGFHIDRPYLDLTGCAEPYTPPLGARAGQWAAELSEEALRRRYAYI